MKAYLLAHEDTVREYFFSDWNQAFGRGEELWILDRIALLQKDYQQFARRPLEKQILSYRTDYIVFKQPIPEKLIGELPNLKLATTTAGFLIYAF